MVASSVDRFLWQSVALSKFKQSREKFFFVEACPAAGKTRFSGTVAKFLLENGFADFVIVVVPQKPIKNGFLKEWSKLDVQITTRMIAGNGRPAEYAGCAVTYQQLPNIMTTIETWAQNGLRILAVIDEIHHASEDNQWGAAVEDLGRVASRVVGLSGTPFRGDGRKISFIRYNERGFADADGPNAHKYSYRDAVRDGACRGVEFITDDSVAEFILHEEESDGRNGSPSEVRISLAEDEAEASRAAKVVFHKDSEWLEKVIVKADDKLEEYRRINPSAAQLIVCRPGADDNDDRHLKSVAEVYRKITRQRAEVVSYNDIDADGKIEKFRDGSDRCIAAVRKISEGVDVPRLQVLIMACRPTTELLFRQIVGRVLRLTDEEKNGSVPVMPAIVYIAAFPQLKKWAEAIQSEASDGLKERMERKKREDSGEDQQGPRFIPLTATHEAAGAISRHGNTYSASEVFQAEKIKNGNASLAHFGITDIAEIIRAFQKAPTVDSEETHEPLEVRKKRERGKLSSLIRRLAISSYPVGASNEQKRAAFKSASAVIYQHTPAKNIDDLEANYPIELTTKVIEIVKQKLSKRSASEAA